MRSIIVAIFVLGVASAVAAEPVRIYIAPVTSTFVDPTSKRLEASRADFIGFLRSEKQLVLVSDAAMTTIHLEVIFSDLVANAVAGLTRLHTVRVKLQMDNYEYVFEGVGISWRMAASQAALQLKAWVKENHAQLER